MADSFGQPENSNMDNDFEKLDPFAPTAGGQPQVETISSSISSGEHDLLGDIYSASAPASNISEAEAAPLMPEAREESPPKKYVETLKPQTQDSAANWLKNIDPRVLDLIYWRDPKKTGVVFGSMMVLLLSLALFSVLSVVAYLSLAALTVTISFRLYKNVIGAVQKSAEGHPFKQYLDLEIALPEDKVHQLADTVLKPATNTIKELRRLFLVEDFVDSLKFGLLLWVLTYIGAWFNGMTLVILGTLAVFTLPKVYETYKTQIDHYIDLARTQIKNVIKQIQEKIPLPGKKKAA